MPAKTKTAIDVTELLHQDHMKVSELFFQFTKAEEDSQKKKLVKQILTELHIHATLEEEIVYPAVEEEVEDGEEIVGEANVEHKVVKYLMAELSEFDNHNIEELDAKITVLCELVKHHVREEEKEMFKKLRQSGADLNELAEQVAKRKEELMSQQLPSMRATLEIAEDGANDEFGRQKKAKAAAKKAPAKLRSA